MDVGLNNRNTFEDPELQDVVFLVEATSCEQHELWFRHSKKAWNFDGISEEIPLGVFSDLDSQRYGALGSELAKLVNTIKERNKLVRKERNHRIDWEPVSTGLAIEIGSIKKKPIVVSFSFAYINGKKIAFYHPCSVAVDHDKVEAWLIKRFQLTHDGYTRWNHTDAKNFWNCVNSLDRLDKKPRNTKYKRKK